MRVLSICFLLLSHLILYTQTDTEVGLQNISIKSIIFSENRDIIISLPQDYSSEKKYPVSYVFDAESLFEGYNDVVQFLADKNVIPQMIVVGIINKNRSLDLTHIADSSSNMQPTGGGQNFESFLIEELIPFIDSSYSSASYRMIAGHSLSGLFATKLLLNSADQFNAFLIMDPALWWNDMEVCSNIQTQLDNPGLQDKKLFLSIANSLPSNIQSIDKALRDTTNATLGIRSILEFKEKMHLSNSNESFWKSRYYEDESHGTVPFISAYDGMKFIFDFYKRPSFQTLTDRSPLILDDHYKKISKKMGYAVLPPANDLGGLAWRCQELEKNNDRAYLFLELYLKYYPNDPLAYMQMGQHFDLSGKKEKAQEYYQKGIELGYDPNGN
jgi:uncharacterized protein